MVIFSPPVRSSVSVTTVSCSLTSSPSAATGSETVTATVLEIAGLETEDTVMVALPLDKAATTPSLLTVATASLSEAKVRDLSVAFSGKTVAVIVCVSPFIMDKEDADRVMSETAIFSLVDSLLEMDELLCSDDEPWLGEEDELDAAGLHPASPSAARERISNVFDFFI